MNEDIIYILFDTDIQNARKKACEMARQIGFDKQDVDKIDIVVSELGTNLIKHRTIHGELIFRTLNDNGHRGIEIISMDNGPGIIDVENVLKRPSSKTGSLGIGLSGVKRMMDEFSIKSRLGEGTTVSTKKWVPKEFLDRMNFSVFTRPIQSESEKFNGDAYFIRHEPEYTIIAVIDALGHGEDAYKTSIRVLSVLEENYRESLHTIIDTCHKELRDMRGAAIALCKIDFTRKIIQHIGVGNVETRIYNIPKSVQPFCFNGTLGMSMERIHIHEYPYNEGACIVMFSDGIYSRFSIPDNILIKSTLDIAKFIFDNYARRTDDVTVLVGK